MIVILSVTIRFSLAKIVQNTQCVFLTETWLDFHFRQMFTAFYFQVIRILNDRFDLYEL